MFLPRMLHHILFFCILLFYSSVFSVLLIKDHWRWYTSQKPQLEVNIGVNKLSQEIVSENIDEETVPDNTFQESEKSDPQKIDLSSVCLDGESLISYNDLKQIVNYLTDNLDSYKSANYSYYDIAIEIRDRYVREIDDFKKWFQDRPLHLKHILVELERIRQTLEPHITDLSSALHEYPHLYTKYKEELDSANMVKEFLESQKRICELTCKQPLLINEHNMLVERGNLETSKENSLDQEHKSYCGTIDKVMKYITEQLEKHAKIINDEMKYKVDADNEAYNNKIIHLKNSLKDKALNDFGRTMYDVLNLQDEYYHFYQSISNINIKHIMSAINQNIARIKPRLMELETNTKKYGKYCRSCNDYLHDGFNLNLRSYYYYDITEDGRHQSNDIIDKLIVAKITEIKKNINEDYKQIFQKLDDKIDHDNLTDNYLINLKPLQDEIELLTNDEFYYLDSLKEQVPKSTVEEIFIMLDSSKKLLNDINREIEYLVQFIGEEDIL